MTPPWSGLACRTCCRSSCRPGSHVVAPCFWIPVLGSVAGCFSFVSGCSFGAVRTLCLLVACMSALASAPSSLWRWCSALAWGSCFCLYHLCFDAAGDNGDGGKALCFLYRGYIGVVGAPPVACLIWAVLSHSPHSKREGWSSVLGQDTGKQVTWIDATFLCGTVIGWCHSFFWRPAAQKGQPWVAWPQARVPQSCLSWAWACQADWGFACSGRRGPWFGVVLGPSLVTFLCS